MTFIPYGKKEFIAYLFKFGMSSRFEIVLPFHKKYIVQFKYIRRFELGWLDYDIVRTSSIVVMESNISCKKENNIILLSQDVIFQALGLS